MSAGTVLLIVVSEFSQGLEPEQMRQVAGRLRERAVGESGPDRRFLVSVAESLESYAADRDDERDP